MNQRKSFRTSFIFLTVLFFLWGFITVLVDSLIPRLREVFTLTYFEAGLVQFAFFGAFFLFSIPAGCILSKIGYKKGIVLGLFTMAAGCLLFYPAASYRIFGIFLFGYFILAAGITIIQVAANPYVTILGPQETASSRLNLSQAFNSLGTAIAPALGASYILSDKVLTSAEIEFLSEAERNSYYINEASAVQEPFKFSETKTSNDYAVVLKNKNLILGAFGIFFYVGAEVALGSYMVNYFLNLDLASIVREHEIMRAIAEGILTTGITASSDMAVVGVFVTFYWTGAMIGRFIGSFLTKIFNPASVLAIFATCAYLLVVISNLSIGLVAMGSLIAVGLFNSIMFPTIFSLALQGLHHNKPQGSGVLCTMIVGGAIIPPAFGFVTDSFSFNVGLILVIFCYAYIFFYAYNNKKFQG